MGRVGIAAGILLTLVMVGLIVSGARANPEKTATLPGGATMEMVWVPPGTFMMGSPDSDDTALDWEKPQHEK